MENAVTIPGVLYIPAGSLQTTTQSNVNCFDAQHLNTHAPGGQFTYKPDLRTSKQRLIRILPKAEKRVSLNLNLQGVNFVNICDDRANKITTNVDSACFEQNHELSSPDCLQSAKVVAVDDLNQIKFQKYMEETCNEQLQCASNEKELTKYEKSMLYLASKEAQDILSDSVLVNEIVMKEKMKNHLKEKTCRCKSYPCKHMKKSRKNSLKKYIQASSRRNDSFGELGTSAKNLADICTQTTVSFKDIDEQQALQATVDTQTLNTLLPYNFTSVEVLETSDFGMQCQLPLPPSDDLLSSDTLLAADNETQTENLFLDTFNFSSNIETQTNILTHDNLVQTDFNGTESSFLDKSVQLSDLWDSNTFSGDPRWRDDFMSYSTGTQTALDDYWFNQNFPSLVANEQNSTSTQTSLLANLDLVDVDFSVSKQENYSNNVTAKEDFSSKKHIKNRGNNNVVDIFDEPITTHFGTQTMLSENCTNSSSTQTFSFINSIFDESASVQKKSTTETQTAISFYDLFEDSSFIDDYLNQEKAMTTIETQTMDDLSSEQSSHIATIETQTDYLDEFLYNRNATREVTPCPSENNFMKERKLVTAMETQTDVF